MLADDPFGGAPGRDEEPTTHGLVQRMRAGDRSAAEELFRMHLPRLTLALRLQLGPEARGLVEREDLVQETLGLALADLDGFEWRGQGAFLAWLVAIARNRLRDLARRGAAAPWWRGAADACEGSGLRGTAGTPSEAAARHEEIHLMEQALARLEPGEREAVVRRKCLGQDYASLASDLGLTQGGARMRVSRAMGQLARWADRLGS